MYDYFYGAPFFCPRPTLYAVRESPVLDHNLRADLHGGPPRRYRPQKSYLALMNSADGRALWRWHALSGHSRLAWLLKDRIDRGFMRKFQVSGEQDEA